MIYGFLALLILFSFALYFERKHHHKTNSSIPDGSPHQSIILYASYDQEKLNGLQPVWAGDKFIYIRVELSNLPFEESLDDARPRKGEVVLNTIPYEEERTA